MEIYKLKNTNYQIKAINTRTKHLTKFVALRSHSMTTILNENKSVFRLVDFFLFFFFTWENNKHIIMIHGSDVDPCRVQQKKTNVYVQWESGKRHMFKMPKWFCKWMSWLSLKWKWKWKKKWQKIFSWICIKTQCAVQTQQQQHWMKSGAHLQLKPLARSWSEKNITTECA